MVGIPWRGCKHLMEEEDGARLSQWCPVTGQKPRPPPAGPPSPTIQLGHPQGTRRGWPSQDHAGWSPWEAGDGVGAGTEQGTERCPLQRGFRSTQATPTPPHRLILGDFSPPPSPSIKFSSSAVAQIFTVRWSDFKFLAGMKERGSSLPGFILHSAPSREEEEEQGWGAKAAHPPGKGPGRGVGKYAKNGTSRTCWGPPFPVPKLRDPTLGGGGCGREATWAAGCGRGMGSDGGAGLGTPGW